jgi:hypothetical protein
MLIKIKNILLTHFEVKRNRVKTYIKENEETSEYKFLPNFFANLVKIYILKFLHFLLYKF